MSRRKRIRSSAAQARRRTAPAAGVRRSDRAWLRTAWVVLPAVVVAAVGAVLLWTLSDDDRSASEAGPVHVHGLGVNPSDGALFVATHTGLFRAADGDPTVVRVGESFQDTMGFTIVGPDRFLGSGHPDARQDLPPLLGLIESTDAGASWEPVSLIGEADFHVLRFAHGRVYGYDVTNDRLLTSRDEGKTWEELPRPGPLLDLAVDPGDERHLVVVAQGQLGPGLFESRTRGEEWSQVASLVGLLAWPAPGRLYVVTPDGEVFVTPDSGRSLELRGKVGGEPAAFLAEGSNLYVALHDGTIQRSVDGGKSWTLRSLP
jgi:hypothetical protein